ncbi:MAG: hypothetical protein IIA88_11735, partial [Bacteroidetes bacterium]|nr:hypothetical protein [Bacteroidota bacterium]
MKQLIIIFAYCLLPTAYFFSCTPKLDIPEPDPGRADFSKVVAIGGNYLAGYQDGALYYNGQRFSIPALLAEQFKLVGGGIFNQPFMPDNSGLGLNSKPWESAFVTKSTLGYKDSILYINTGSCNCDSCWGRGGLSPIKRIFGISEASSDLKPLAGGNFQNLSIPFATLQDLFNPALGNSYPNGNLYYHRFTINTGVSTVMSDALVQNPTFFILWLGIEDVFKYARNGGYNVNIPDTSSFGTNLDSVLSSLTTNGAKGVIANIPDLASFPFYTLIPYNAAEMSQSEANTLNDTIGFFCQLTGDDCSHLNFTEGDNAFIIEDPNEPSGYGFRHMHPNEYILLNVPLDSMKCFLYGLFLQPIHDRYVLDKDELLFIQDNIKMYNQLIAQKASKYDLALVDMHAYFNKLQLG